MPCLGGSKEKESIKKENENPRNSLISTRSLSLSLLVGSVTPYLIELNRLIAFIGRIYLGHENVLAPLDFNKELVAVLVKSKIHGLMLLILSAISC